MLVNVFFYIFLFALSISAWVLKETIKDNAKLLAISEIWQGVT